MNNFRYIGVSLKGYHKIFQSNDYIEFMIFGGERHLIIHMVQFLNL